MAQAKRSTDLEHRTNRLKLAPKKEPYWTALAEGQHVGYYRPGDKSAGTWTSRWRDRATGKRTIHALGTADDYADADGIRFLSWPQAQAKAREWFDAQDKEARRRAEGEGYHEGPYTVADAMEDYRRDCERRGVKGTYVQGCQTRAHILPHLGEVEVARLTRIRLEKWMEAVAKSPRLIRGRKGEPPRPGAPLKTEEEKRARKDTANRVWTILLAALNHAHDRRKVAGETPWRDVRPYKNVARPRIRFLSQEDQVRLVNACPPGFRELVQGALLTGARYGELCRLRVEDFHADSGTVFVAESKSGKPRHIALTEEAQGMFATLTLGREGADPIFRREGVHRTAHKSLGEGWGPDDTARFMGPACEAAGISPLTFHELRHSYASMLINRGVPLAFVAAQLGHSDTRMVEKHYGHLAPSALAESIRKLVPSLGLVEPTNVEPLSIKTS